MEQARGEKDRRPAGEWEAAVAAADEVEEEVLGQDRVATACALSAVKRWTINRGAPATSSNVRSVGHP